MYIVSMRLIDDKKVITDEKDNISEAFNYAVQFMGKLTVPQLDALNISATTVHWLEEAITNNKVNYGEDPHPNSTLQMYRLNCGDIFIRSAKDFNKVPDRALAWAILSEIKDFDQMVKGEQSFGKTAPDDIDDKLLHQISEHQLPIVHNAMSGLLQAVTRERTAHARHVTRTYSEMVVMPVFAMMAHRTIAHRCDKFAANLLSMSYADYVGDISPVIPYEPVAQNWYNFCTNTNPSDKKRISKTQKTVAGSEAFRKKHAIPEYSF